MNVSLDNARNTIEIPTNQNENTEIPLNKKPGLPPVASTVANSSAGDVGVEIEMSPSSEETQKAPEEKVSKVRKEKPRDEVTFRTHLTSLAHISVLVFVYLVIRLSFRGDFVFFTWHPILMAVGWMLMMTEGFYSINKYNTYWRLKTKGGFRVKIHVTILAIGYILSIIGFVIVYLNKENNNKSHFTSWHAIFGLIGIVSTFPPVINGLLLWYKKELSNYISYPRLVKFVHVSSGTLAFSFGALALVLSVYTRWFGKKSLQSDTTFYFALLTVTYPLVWAVYGPSVKLARVIKEYFSEEKDD
ncbi:unnamed protein product [Ceutorhynchus assimilis]|uniref:ascorbate ferrireductase (transmembrane) n=1 Tax=Ceutorhynchus assimilis TaxID=467358 RepID=A0A9N9MKQ9_9CUCU|nr:unnamed protein product [Ceutorhynchus assimilis]